MSLHIPQISQVFFNQIERNEAKQKTKKEVLAKKGVLMKCQPFIPGSYKTDYQPTLEDTVDEVKWSKMGKFVNIYGTDKGGAYRAKYDSDGN